MSGHRITADLLKADTVLLDPGNGGVIRAEGWLNVVEFVTGSGNETRTIAAPDKSGQQLVLTHKTDGGGYIDVTGPSKYTSGGSNTTLQFADALDTVVFVSIPDGTSGYKWIIVVNDGATLS